MKYLILKLLERAGYVVQRAADYAQAQRDIARLVAVERKLAQADQDFRLGRDRDSRELEQARSESWQLHERLAATLDEIRRLKIRVGDVPKLNS